MGCLHSGFRLREAVTPLLGASLLFYGSLANRTDLHHEATRAVQELRDLGYRVPTADTPLRIRSLSAPSTRSPHLAGGWRSGEISLRRDPVSTFGEVTYLRHELMHEAYHRTCSPLPPEWEQEAAALAFSGEVGGIETVASEPEGALSSLRKVVAMGGALSSGNRTTLTRLLAEKGWPSVPCKRSEELYKLLTAGEAEDTRTLLQGSPDTALNYIHLDLQSGRILARSERRRRSDLGASGASELKAPIGSLHKLPLATAFAEKKSALELGRALVRSDTEFFVNALQAEPRGAATDVSSGRGVVCGLLDAVVGLGREGKEGCGSISASVLAGESPAEGGGSPFLFSLLEAARLIRLSVLRAPSAFSRVPPHADDSRATLYKSSPELHRALLERDAWVKTGSVTSKQGEPLWGYLAVVWPRSAPTELLVFRRAGVRGAQIGAELSQEITKRLSTRSPLEARSVAIPLLSTLPRAAYTVEGECTDGAQEFSADCLISLAQGGVSSVTGLVRVTTSAKNARHVRFMRGVLFENARKLITDPYSYVEGVVSAEGDGLPKAARDALAATILWNATQGELRHVDDGAQVKYAEGYPMSPFRGGLCDTTHCMVFKGTTAPTGGAKGKGGDGEGVQVSKELMGYLHQRFLSIEKRRVAGRASDEASSQVYSHERWLEYSTGGTKMWKQEHKLSEVSRPLLLESVVTLRRERTREGEIYVNFEGIRGGAGLHSGRLSCDEFVNALDLPSCPDEVYVDETRSTLYVSGVGMGHGRGLDLLLASRAARNGDSALSILINAFPTF